MADKSSIVRISLQTVAMASVQHHIEVVGGITNMLKPLLEDVANGYMRRALPMPNETLTEGRQEKPLTEPTPSVPNTDLSHRMHNPPHVEAVLSHPIPPDQHSTTPSVSLLHTAPHLAPHHATSRYITRRHATPHHATPRHITRCHATTPRYTTPHHATPRQPMPRHITPIHTNPHQNTPRHTTPHHTTPHHATPPEAHHITEHNRTEDRTAQSSPACFPPQR